MASLPAEMNTPSRREHRLLALIVVAYLVLSAAFSTGPIFEPPDEIEHFRFARTIGQSLALPSPFSQPRGQYHQAPLYYLILVSFARILDSSDFAEIDGRLNPYYPGEISVPGNDNKNLYLHTRAEDFPYTSNTARTVHLLRLISIVLGACTVLSSYAIFQLLWPDRMDRRLLATAIVAFWPQFLYMSGTINNDPLLYLLSTVTLYLLLRIVNQREGQLKRLMLMLGAVLGAVLLTKVSAMFLVFPVAATFALNRRTWRYVPLTAAIILLIAGWWYLRNWVIVGDPVGVRALQTTWSADVIRNNQIAFDIGSGRVPFAYSTLWARFGHGAVSVSPVFYQFFDGIILLSLLGTVIGFLVKRRVSSPLAPTMLIFGLAWLAALIYYSMIMWSGNQGRYLLPALAVWAALIAYGLDSWTPSRLRLPITAIGNIVLFVVAAICVFGYFLPSYRPLPVTAKIEKPLSLHYGDLAELIGMSPAMLRVRPGDMTEITLYWRALRSGNWSLQSYLHTNDGKTIRRDSIPGTGNLPATEWQAGQTWAERYLIQIPFSASRQTVTDLLAGLYDTQTQAAIPLTSGATPIIGTVAITGDPTQLPVPAYRFGEGIGLLEAPTIRQDSSSLEICLKWGSLAVTPTNYTLFVHVRAADKSVIAQVDDQPKHGTYPTSAWLPGEIIADCNTINLPDNASPTNLAIGLYDSVTGQRPPVMDATGTHLADDQLVIPVNGS